MEGLLNTTFRRFQLNRAKACHGLEKSLQDPPLLFCLVHNLVSFGVSATIKTTIKKTQM